MLQGKQIHSGGLNIVSIIYWITRYLLEGTVHIWGKNIFDLYSVRNLYMSDLQAGISQYQSSHGFDNFYYAGANC